MNCTEMRGSVNQMVKKGVENIHINAIVIPTNSVVKNNGKATLPSDVAEAISEIWYEVSDPDGSNKRTMRASIRDRLAFLMKSDGRHRTRLIGEFFRGKAVVGLPHKFHWRNDEDQDLILQEAKRLVKGINQRQWKFVVMLRPMKESKKWDLFKKQLFSVLSEASGCKFGIYDGVEVAEEKPPHKAFKDMTPEEQSNMRSHWGRLGAATRKENKLQQEQEKRRKKIEGQTGVKLD